MFVELNGEEVEILIEIKKNKNIYFRINDDLKLYITCNKHVKESELIKIIKENKYSLSRMYEKKKNQLKKEEVYYYLGKPITVIFDETVKRAYKEDDFIFTKDNKSLDKFYTLEAKKIFENRINYIKPYISFVPDFSLKIRSMKTRWGVCNKTKKIITLNKELIKKDISLLDYVIVHELCHFKYPHHQASFWEEVSKYYPDYKKARKLLRS